MISITEDATKLLLTGSPSELATLEQVFRFRPNGYFFTPSFKEYEYTDGRSGWDGWIKPLRIHGRNSDRAFIDRGRRDEVLTACRLHKIKIDTSQMLPRYFQEVTLEDIPGDLLDGGLILDDNQRNCILAWLHAGIGINKVSIAGGKTIMLAGVSKIVKSAEPDIRILYLTTSERLVNQVMREMKRFLPKWNITQYGGGKNDKSGADMVVATLAILNRNFRDLVDTNWFESFGVILFDECHKASSATAGKVLKQMRAYFRFGCSDSLRKDNPSAYYQIVGLLGPVLKEVKVSKLMGMGRVAKPTIYVVERESWKGKFDNIPHSAVKETPAWVLLDEGWKKAIYLGPVFQRDEQGNPIVRKRTQFDEDAGGKVTIKEQATETGMHAMEIDGEAYEVESTFCLLERLYDKAIVQFHERNDLIVEWARWYAGRGLPTLIVCTRTLHCIILEALIKDEGTPEEDVRVLLGDHTSRERDEALNWIREKSERGRILISPLIKEGVSINELRAGVIADYIADYEVANQIVGRFIRQKFDGDNVAEITFFVDHQHPVLRRNGSLMLKNLARIDGYEFIRPVLHPPGVNPSL